MFIFINHVRIYVYDNVMMYLYFYRWEKADAVGVGVRLCRSHQG